MTWLWLYVIVAGLWAIVGFNGKKNLTVAQVASMSFASVFWPLHIAYTAYVVADYVRVRRR